MDKEIMKEVYVVTYEEHILGENYSNIEVVTTTLSKAKGYIVDTIKKIFDETSTTCLKPEYRINIDDLVFVEGKDLDWGYVEFYDSPDKYLICDYKKVQFIQ